MCIFVRSKKDVFMMKFVKYSIVVCMMLLLPITAAGVFLFKSLNALDGLTASQVNCILKDSRGFVWFGTSAGLYRYDGYTFKTFQSDSQSGSSLPDSYIMDIQEALGGNLWVKTAAGYCIYQQQTEAFERDMTQVCARMSMPEVPAVLYIDSNKNLWGFIPKKGVICYNMQQQMDFIFDYESDAFHIPAGNICSIGECKDGALLVYDDGRIVCCDVRKQQRIVWQNSEIAEKALRNSKSLRAYADQNGYIWLYGQGTLFCFNTKTKTWDTNIGDQLGLTGIGVDNAVNSMAGDRNGNIWIGTNRHGLIRANAETHEMEHVQPVSMDRYKTMAPNMSIQSLYVDDTDLLWVGTEKFGVAYWGKHIYKFDSNPIGDITAMVEDPSGRIWYGTGGNGILDYDGPLASLNVSAMAYTKDGSLWVGSKKNGLTRIVNGRTITYAHSANNSSLIDDHINALATDKTGNLWIATEGGLQVYNTRMNTFSAYTKENGKMKTNNIVSLFYARGNHMLVGTAEGLTIIDLANGETMHLTGNSSNLQKFTNNYITQIYEDSRNLIWIGTREGVNVLDLEYDNLSFITEKSGLCNNNICGIAEDKHHNMWITTSNGVSRVVLQRNHENNTYNFGLYNYTTSDGLQSNEFNPGAIIVNKYGNVVLGGLYGINWVRKKADNETEGLPTVMLTQLFVGEEEILTGHEYEGHIPLPQALNESKRIELKNNQNTFTIKFAAGNYNQSERLQFMYLMEGYDPEWHNGDALLHGVSFHDLSSGTYKLHVKALSADGAVSNEERVLEIVIERPWYLSWYMIAIYLIVGVAALYLWKKGFDQIRAFRLRKKAVVSNLLRQREEIKATSDDLREPMIRMTSIITDLSEREDITPDEREQLNNLHSQMLQVITRVADMQMVLENPEEKAKQEVHNRFQLNSKGELSLLASNTEYETLTSEERRVKADSPTSKFKVVFIDDNIEFLNFTAERLRYVYDFHIYDSIGKADKDISIMKPDLIVCKHDMPGRSGSAFCNQIKSNASTAKIKFILMTEGTLTPQEMKAQNISMAADDWLAKPFNIQEAIMRFNVQLGIGPINVGNNLIEGSETRRLENRTSSMTTASESIDLSDYTPVETDTDENDEIQAVEVTFKKKNALAPTETAQIIDDTDTDPEFDTYSMADQMDRQLLQNIEQYVVQNMSRGQISLEELSATMGMGRVPFFHKIRNITGKTPTELVRDMRLKRACILLKQTNINMNELATNVGFPTGENFIKVFKDKFGISPLEYRLKHRRQE